MAKGLSSDDFGGCLIALVVYGLIIYLLSLAYNGLFGSDIDKPVLDCLKAIEARNWEDYRSSFEPSAVLQQYSPGTPIHFLNPKIRVINQFESSALVELTANVKFDAYKEQMPLVLQLTLIKVNKSGILGSLGVKKWYLASSQSNVLSFNYLQE
jgi:hypothetical protein